MGETITEGAFEGVRVVELAQWVFVPVAGALLADWGADVIHIEPIEGDPYRGLASQGIGTDRGGVNLPLALANRGKRSVALNIQSEQGQAVLHRQAMTDGTGQADQSSDRPTEVSVRGRKPDARRPRSGGGTRPLRRESAWPDASSRGTGLTTAVPLPRCPLL